MREMKPVTGNDTYLYPEETVCVAALEFFFSVCVCVYKRESESDSKAAIHSGSARESVMMLLP